MTTVGLFTSVNVVFIVCFLDRQAVNGSDCD